nr:ionotropic glutamate receptor 9 [Achelura yunnanensis]
MGTSLLFILVLFNLNDVTVGEKNYLLPIGGLFNRDTESSSVKAFENIMNKKKSDAYHGRIIKPTAPDSYSTSLYVCSDTSDGNGLVALIDVRPTEGICDIICLLCNKLKINHLSVGWQMPESFSINNYTLAYHPPYEVISKAYATLIRNLQWDKFAILYEDDDSLLKLQEVINTWPDNNEPIIYIKLDQEGDNREKFKGLLKVEHVTYHILDCAVKNTKKYMKEIVHVENSTQYLSFILTSLDAYTINFTELPQLMANVSTFHLTNSNTVEWKDININTGDIKLETALTADALNHLEKSIRSMKLKLSESTDFSYQEGNENLRFNVIPALCQKELTEEKVLPPPWEFGDYLQEALISTTYKGFTGNIQFDEGRKRKDFTLHYSKLNNESNFFHFGIWESKTDTITKDNEYKSDDHSLGIKSGSTLKIVSRNGKPYFEQITEANGTISYTGYAVDLIKLIFEHMNTKQGIVLNYEFYRVSGDLYGNIIQGTKKWNGLIGELLEHNADLAICDITITSERNSVVDFSMPFMSLGIGMLFHEEEAEPPNMFSFMAPLSLDVWLYLATAYILVSFILLICARMSQDDWVNPHPCNQNPENLQNIWTLYNCMWLTMGAIMTQGCDILPRGGSSRWTTSVWWFFALIITSSYTANMSAFISNERRTSGITDVKSLSEQTKVTYGTVLNASTYKFFKSSNDTVISKLWQDMETAKPNVFTANNEEGRDRVLRSKGKYAFFMESTTIDYYTNRYCKLKSVGNKLDSKEYGIAMPKNSPHRLHIDNAILALQESSELENLQKKWWADDDNPERCQDKEKQESTDNNGSMQMENTSGIFLVLGFGGILGMIVALIDFLLHAQKICVKEKITFKEAVISEWRVSFDPRSVHKPAVPPRSAVPSAETSPQRERSRSRAVSVLGAATSFINFDEIY